MKVRRAVVIDDCESDREFAVRKLRQFGIEDVQSFVKFPEHPDFVDQADCLLVLDVVLNCEQDAVSVMDSLSIRANPRCPVLVVSGLMLGMLDTVVRYGKVRGINVVGFSAKPISDIALSDALSTAASEAA